MDTVSIDVASLHSLVGGAEAPLILDVRRQAAYEADPRMLPAATRPRGDVLDFAFAAKPRRIVACCVHGHEVSQEAARRLSAAGFDAAFLAGGFEAWTEAGLPTFRPRPAWNVPGGSRWITRERPKIDRVACPWLILRFLDPRARFDYVPASQVMDEARARSAVPFDIPGAEVGHRGERCSFDALLEDFELHDPALEHLATIVRGADTDRLELSPRSPGLLAASLELSRRHVEDQEMLAQAMAMYDGLYAACRAECEARSYSPAR